VDGENSIQREKTPVTFVGPLEEPLKRLKDMEEKGQWKERIDYEMLLWGLEEDSFFLGRIYFRLVLRSHFFLGKKFSKAMVRDSAKRTPRNGC